jgi:hypothetical protein
MSASRAARIISQMLNTVARMRTTTARIHDEHRSSIDKTTDKLSTLFAFGLPVVLTAISADKNLIGPFFEHHHRNLHSKPTTEQNETVLQSRLGNI